MRLIWLQDNHLSMPFIESLHLHSTDDWIVLCETRQRFQQFHHHKQKIVFHLTALRHFEQRLRDAGYRVVRLQTNTLTEALEQLWCQLELQLSPDTQEQIEWLTVLPTDWAWRERVVAAANGFVRQAIINGFRITELQQEEDFLFLVPYHEWSALLKSNIKWTMEFIYRKLRERFQLLMENDQPCGDKWNFDADNRKPAKSVPPFVEAVVFPPDEITQQVIAEVNEQYSDHPGTLESFIWPVTAEQAEQAAEHFFSHRFADFGDYQDAMLSERPLMSHSLLAASVNVGLLSPLELCRMAETEYRQKRVSLSSAEGFIRQILGWREYVRGVYIEAGPTYSNSNTFRASRPLPHFFWTAQTEMNCLRTVIRDLLENGYSHHIQRLMILCNFALLSGIEPQQVNDWFNQMYIDSADWVVTPNVIGMGLHADGGKMASKPYISSAQYIKKMSDYCRGCKYKPDVRTGENACPFNSLYWSFIGTHATELHKNRRMQMMVASWRKMPQEDQQKLLEQADEYLQSIERL